MVDRTARLMLALLALLALGIGAVTAPKFRRVTQAGIHRPYKVVTGARVSPLARALRPNYPYSVIPGGVYNPEELRAAMERDPALREHYAGFDANKARLVRLTEDRYSFVSYRQNGRFYWTKKKLRIAAGEVLLTDGVHYSKTRCGNRLSDLPSRPTQQSNQAEARLSPPPLTERTLAGLTFVPSPEDSAAGGTGFPAAEAASAPPAGWIAAPQGLGNARPGPALPAELASPFLGSESLGGPSSGPFWGSPSGGGFVQHAGSPPVGGQAGVPVAGSLAQIAPVPEPSGIFLLCVAFAAFLGAAALRRRSADERLTGGESRFRR